MSESPTSSLDLSKYSGLNASKNWSGSAWILNSEYQIGKKINAGSFGELRLARNIRSREICSAKLEKNTATEDMLCKEFNFYKKLGCYAESNEAENPVGFPRVFYFGQLGSNYKALVMDFLGVSLSSIFEKCHKKFTLKTVLMIAKQLLERIEYIHSKNIIHRDINLHNLLIGRCALGTEKIIHIVDFGLSEEYVHWHKTRKETEPPVGRVRGTPLFMSVNTHKKIKHSKRDDLESILYVLVYMLKGQLPWSFCPVNRLNDMLILKNQDPKITCKNFPEEFSTYLTYVRGLEFSDRPDYDYLKNLFKNLFEKSKFVYDLFDWSAMNLENFVFT